MRAVARLLEYDPTLLTCAYASSRFTQSLIQIHPTRNLTSHPPDTLYADASAISEKPISAIKAQFDYWFDKAMWHRPTILILDDLDKLLGAELELSPVLIMLFFPLLLYTIPQYALITTSTH